MPRAVPAAGAAIQIVGYTWRSGTLALRWRPWDEAGAGWRAVGRDEPRTWTLPPDSFMHLVAARPGAPGARLCVGYRPPAGGPELPCPDGCAVPAGSRSECDACMAREGRLEVVTSDGSRLPTGPRAEYLLSAHDVYLAAFAPDVLKVGVSGAGRARLRVLEQGAPAGLVIGRADDGMAARRLEHALSQMGTRERVQVRTKLRHLFPAPDASALLARLGDALERLADALPGGWPIDVERMAPPAALDNTPLLHLTALDAPPIAAPPAPAGSLAGQVVAAAGALLVVRAAQPTLWGDVAPAAPAAH